MNNLSDATRQLLSAYHRHPRKSLGQHFLINEEILNRLVGAAQINPPDTVIEIGTGLGVLTEALAKTCQKVITIEYDKELLGISKEVLIKYSNIEYIGEDILKYDLENTTKRLNTYKIVSNLPYYITTPILNKIFQLSHKPALIVITVQKEIAERITAKPGSKNYSSLTIFTNFFCEPFIHSLVPRFAFYPKPEVSSAIVVLKPYATLPWDVDEKIFFSLVHKAFNQRRKQLRNSLEAYLPEIEKTGIDLSRRPETLSMDEFIKLTKTAS